MGEKEMPAAVAVEGGQSEVCRFVRAGTHTALGERLAVYKRFRQLVDCWIALSIQRGIMDFFPASPTPHKPTKAKPVPAPRTRRPRT